MQRKPLINDSNNIDDFLMKSKDSKIDAKPEVKEHKSLINLDEIIKKDKGGKAKTYYYDTDVLKHVSAAAKKKGISESKLINDILRHVLNVQ